MKYDQPADDVIDYLNSGNCRLEHIPCGIWSLDRFDVIPITAETGIGDIIAFEMKYPEGSLVSLGENGANGYLMISGSLMKKDRITEIDDARDFENTAEIDFGGAKRVVFFLNS